jgi:hypothetical protein
MRQKERLVKVLNHELTPVTEHINLEETLLSNLCRDTG